MMKIFRLRISNISCYCAVASWFPYFGLTLYIVANKWTVLLEDGSGLGPRPVMFNAKVL